MQIVYRAQNIIDANLVSNALEQAGIPCHIGGQYLTGALGELPVSGLVTVMVAKIDLERAQAIADEIDAALRIEPESAADFLDPAFGTR